MNREEYEKALEHIRTLRGSNYGEYYSRFSSSSLTFDEDYNALKNLIQEHFDNPPLTFGELKVGMWIWDNNWNQYFEICEIYPKTKEFDVLIHQNRINRLRYEPMKFEENRFYRKEVQE